MIKSQHLPTFIAALSLSLPYLANGFSLLSAALAPLKQSPITTLPSTAVSLTESDEKATAFWKWRGHDIYTEVRSNSFSDGKKPTVILLHGFGASTMYWRETMAVLENEGYDVHALDMLGLGRSSKPFPAEEASSQENKDIPVMEMGKNTDTKVEYSIDLWGNMVDDYARFHQLDDVVLMGNSIGSLVALSAATGNFITNSEDAYIAGNNSGEGSRVKGLCLFNCGIGLNSRNVVKNPDLSPIQRAAFNGLFDVLNGLIFDNKFLLQYALNNIVTKELLEDALKSLYIVSPERVDSELVDSFYYPAKTGGEGAVEAIRQIYTNDAGLTPMEYHEKYPEILDSLPLHLVWGLEDVVTPIKGDVGSFYLDRVANNRAGNGMTSIDVVKSGHMPFDDNPVESHEAMVKWLNRKVVK